MSDSNDLKGIIGHGAVAKTCTGTEEKACAGTAEKFPGRMPLRMPALPGDDVYGEEMGTEASTLDNSCESEENETNGN